MHHLAVSCTHLACALPGRPPSRPRALKSSGPRHRPWVLAILQAVLDSFGNHPALRSLDSERLLRGRTRPSDPIAHSASTAMRMASSVVKRMPSSAASASPYAWRPEAASTVSKAASRTTSKKVRPTKKAPVSITSATASPFSERSFPHFPTLSRTSGSRLASWGHYDGRRV